MKKKGKGFIGEFKEFVMRGNVMDLAVGVIIGGAFQSIVSSLVNDVIMPVITLVTGGIHFENWFLAMDGNHYATYEEAKAAGAAVIGYGTFLTAVINFLIMAFVIFLLVKGMNRLSDANPLAKKGETEEAEPTTKICPFCKSEIPVDATKCAHCTADMPEEELA